MQEYLWGDAMELRTKFDVTGHVGEDLVKVGDGGGEVRLNWRAVGAAKEEGARVAKDTVHVANQLVRCPHPRCGAEVSELGRGIAEGLLCPVGEGGQKVLEKDSLFIHLRVPLRREDSCARRRL